MESRNNLSVAKKSSIESHYDVGFLPGLTCDMVLEICSYLDQTDCLTCMTVCRDWYNSIPQYTQSTWKTLQLDTRDIYRSHKRREKCLGSHTKDVRIKAAGNPEKAQKSTANLWTLMQRLIDWGCTDIQILEIRNFTLSNDKAFTWLLKKVAPRLMHLKLINVPSRITIMRILDSCHHITRFTCIQSGFTWRKKDIYNPSLSAIYRPTSIKHIDFNSAIDTKHLECVLKMCPDLRSFNGRTVDNWKSMTPHSVPPQPFDIISLLTWCPKVNYLTASFYSWDRSSEFTVENPESYVSNDTGLRYLALRGFYRGQQMLQCLANNQQTMEYLEMRGTSNSEDWGSLRSQTVDLPKLRKLIFNNNSCNSSFLVTFLRHCPILETLAVCILPVGELIATESLGILHHLRSIEWTLVWDNSNTLLFTVLKRSPALERLSINGFSDYMDMPKEFIGLKNLNQIVYDGEYMPTDIVEVNNEASVRFLEYLAENSRLEILRCSNVVRFQRSTLRKIASIPSLQQLDIHLDPKLQKSHLMEFMSTLGQRSINSLCLYGGCNFVSFGILHALTNFPLLTTFTWDLNEDKPAAKLHQKGLEELLRKSPKLAEIRFRGPLVIERCEEASKPFTEETIYDWIEQQVPQHIMTSDTSGRWKVTVEGFNDGTQEIDDITISRVYS